MQKAVAFSIADGFPPSEVFAQFFGRLLHSVIWNVRSTQIMGIQLKIKDTDHPDFYQIG